MDNLQFHTQQFIKASAFFDAAIIERKQQREEQDRKQVVLVSLRTRLGGEASHGNNS